MKYVLGVLVVILFTILAVYVGLGEMFIGGIVQGIEGIKADPASSTAIAIGVVKVVFASFVGCGIFFLGLLFGGGIAGTSFKKKKKKTR